MHLNQIELDTAAGPHAEQVSRFFFWQRILERNSGDFQAVRPETKFMEKVEDLVSDHRSEIRVNLDEFGDLVADVGQDILFPAEASERVAFRRYGMKNKTSAWKYSGDATDKPVLLFLLDNDSTTDYPVFEESGNRTKFLLITNSQEDNDKFIGFLGNETSIIEKTVGDFVSLETFNTGGQIVHDYFDARVSNSTLKGWYSEDPTNEFEEDIYKVVMEITNMSISNVNIETDVGENPEYDLVCLPLGNEGECRFAIEVKDYLQDKNGEVEEAPAVSKAPGELRSELITRPKEEADRADLDLITVVKGLSEDQYDNLRRHADSSNVTLLTDENCKDGLSDELFEKPLRSV